MLDINMSNNGITPGPSSGSGPDGSSTSGLGGQCSEDEQINRDLLQLRRHLALLTTKE